MGEGFEKKTRGEDCKDGPRFESASALPSLQKCDL